MLQHENSIWDFVVPVVAAKVGFRDFSSWEKNLLQEDCSCGMVISRRKGSYQGDSSCGHNSPCVNISGTKST